VTATIRDAAPPTTPLPLLAFVHVPKTAGSTVNAVLGHCSPRGLSHCEGILHTDAFLDHASDCDWLSGHISRDDFAGKLIWRDRPIEYFATTREPIAQLLSGLNWHFEVSHRGIESFLAHSIAAQRNIAEVQATDFSRLYSIMALLLKPDSGFLNCQARYILGADFASISDSEITRRLNSYCYIATEQTLPDLYQAFGFAEIPRDANEFRENAASKYHFDTTIFKTPELRAFLAFHHRHDIALYDLVRQTSWSAQGRCPFRPAFPIATPENFDEQAYLAANPDVATAMRANGFRSGRDHFDAFGHAEVRRKLALPPVLWDRPNGVFSHEAARTDHSQT
jgi:hypothetical protein